MSGRCLPPPRSRQEARALGLKTYRSGRACQGGHGSERLASSGKCPECVQAQKLKGRLTVAKLTDKLKAQLRAQVLRELTQEQAREAKAAIKAQEAEARKQAKEAAKAAALEAMPEADRAAALKAQRKATRTRLKAAREAELAEQHKYAQAEAQARFHASAINRPRPGVATLPAVSPNDDGEAPPWD